MSDMKPQEMPNDCPKPNFCMPAELRHFDCSLEVGCIEHHVSRPNYRKLGHTGFDISTVGFGTWQIGGGRWKGIPEKEALTLLNTALDRGINIYDCAVVYGQYRSDQGSLESRSQEFLGKAFRHQRGRLIYCVKIGQFDEFSHRSCYRPDRMIDQFVQSMRRLHTDYIDICLVHAPSLHDVRSGLPITVLETLRALGMVRAIGYSFENEPEHAFSAIQQSIDVLMVQYNIMECECETVIRAAHEHGIGVLVGGPFKRGLLTGQFRCLHDFPEEDDYWRYNIMRNPIKLQRLLSSVSELAEVYGHGQQLRAAALQFVLRHSGVTAAMIGIRSLEELHENINLVAHL